MRKFPARMLLICVVGYLRFVSYPIYTIDEDSCANFSHMLFCSIVLPVRLTLYKSFRPVNECCVVCLAPAVCVFPARLASLRLPPLLIHDTISWNPLLNDYVDPSYPPALPACACLSFLSMILFMEPPS